jgi:hypothetical protein
MQLREFQKGCNSRGTGNVFLLAALNFSQRFSRNQDAETDELEAAEARVSGWPPKPVQQHWPVLFIIYSIA